MDIAGLGGAVALGSLLAATGIAVDALLLERHAKWFDELALRWWNFFDDLRIIDLPRVAISLFVQGKNHLLGHAMDLGFLVRSGLVSLVLTALAIPGGRALALVILDMCTQQSGGSPIAPSHWWYITAAWGYTGFRNILALAPLNLGFDVVTIFVTAFLLALALRRNNAILITLVVLDILACLVLLETMIIVSDRFDIITLTHGGFGSAIRNTWEMLGTAGCATAHVVLPRLVYCSTVLLPTLIYLTMIVVLFILRQGFELLRWLAMYLFEKSVEDRKTIFAHLGVTLGLVVACGKAVLEIARLWTANAP